MRLILQRKNGWVFLQEHNAVLHASHAGEDARGYTSVPTWAGGLKVPRGTHVQMRVELLSK